MQAYQGFAEHGTQGVGVLGLGWDQVCSRTSIGSLHEPCMPTRAHASYMLGACIELHVHGCPCLLIASGELEGV